MDRRRLRDLGLVGFLALAAGCGGGATHSMGSGTAASAAGVEISGRIAQRGTRGSVLVFAYTELAPTDDPAGREAASVGTVGPDGAFDVSVPASPSVTLIFLADGSNDGAVDEGDPTAALSSPELADLQAGDRVQVSDAKLDFATHRVSARVEVTRGSEPARTPTTVPAR